MTESELNETVTLDDDDLEALWQAWAAPGDDDILARAAFERTIRAAAGLEDDGLYFRPGGWTLNLTATVARTVVAAGILAAAFQLAGLEDVDREIIISAASLVASMDLRPVRPGRQERRLADRIRQGGLADQPISAKQARRTLPRERRDEMSLDAVADALDRLVAAGLADHEDDEWVIRAKGSEAWIRLRLSDEH